MTQLVFDDDAARRIEAMYYIGDAVRRRRLVRDALRAQPGEHIVDAGCGPGFYCAELAADVGPGGSVVGVDGSSSMLALAEHRCAALPNVGLHEGDVTALPLDDGAFDAAICVQVLEYVPDVATGLSELHRVLRPGGRVTVWDIDWATVSMHADDPELTDRVLAAWDEHLHDRSLPRTLRTRLCDAGFADVRAEAHAFATVDFDADSYGVALIPIIGAFVAGRGGVSAEDATRWLDEQRSLGERGAFYFASTQVCFSAQKPR